MTFSELKGFNSVFDQTLSNDIQDGLVEFFDWGLLQKGNYFNTTLGETSPNGQDYSRLTMRDNAHYSSGQVWEGFRSNWVWQSGISYSPAPINGTDHENPGVSGIFIDDNYYPITTTGTYAYHVDYINGRVIFDSAVPTGTKVQVEHSYRYINVIYANDLPWIKEVQYRTQEPDANFLDQSDDQWRPPPEMQLQLPAIAIEIVPMRKFKGYQLGGGQWVYTDVLFHCIAENETDRNKLIDIISFQNDKNVDIFDSNTASASGASPIDYRGVPVPSALRHPDLVNYYPGGRLKLTNTRVQEMKMINTGLFGGIVRTTTEGIKTNI